MELDPLRWQQLRVCHLLDQRVPEGKARRVTRLGPDQHVVVDGLVQQIQQRSLRDGGDLSDQRLRRLASDGRGGEDYPTRLGGKGSKPGGEDVVQGGRQMRVDAVARELLDEERVAVRPHEDTLNDVVSRAAVGEVCQLVGDLRRGEGRDRAA